MILSSSTIHKNHRRSNSSSNSSSANNTGCISKPPSGRRSSVEGQQSSSSSNRSIPVSQHARELILDATSELGDTMSVGSAHSRSSNRSNLRRQGSVSGVNVQREIDMTVGVGTSIMQKLLDTGGSNRGDVSKDDERSSIKNNAASFARTAPRAGFLCKLDPKTREFTRQFFVLKPSTHLYYFSSPSDTQPIGCIDLETSGETGRIEVREVESCEDGRVRFEVVVYNVRDIDEDVVQSSSTKSLKTPKQRILLEARSKVVFDEWMESLSTERLSFAKDRIYEQSQQEDQLQRKISDLQNQILNLKLVVKEKDDKLIEFENSRDRTEKLSEAMEILSRQLRTSPLDNEKNQETCKSENSFQSNFGTVTEDDRLLESYKVVLAETGFASLSNACYMIRENLRLTSIEANSSLKEIHEEHAKYSVLQKRMSKAEKLLTKLWEENCALREKVRHLKVQKKNLSKQMTSMTESSEKISKKVESQEKYTQATDYTSCNTNDDCSRAAIPVLSTKEQTLLQELEEHIATSMSLHKKLMSKKGPTETASSDSNSKETSDLHVTNPELEPLEQITGNKSASMAKEGNIGNSIEQMDNEAIEHVSMASTSVSPMQPRNILAELDTSGLTEQDDLFKPSLDMKGKPSLNEPIRKEIPLDHAMRNSMIEFYEEDDHSFAPQMSSSSSISSVTDNWRATSRINAPDELGNEGQIYHITFHTKKIGLQFHKIPASSFVRGSLSHAMSSDRRCSPDDRDLIDKPNINETSNDWDFGDKLNAAEPIDAVLVCGFRGFDSTSNNRPKLGARLVGFDSMSIERGKWSFENVRNAIQSRGRPITLSFRNDFLTNEQRLILERACAENDESVYHELYQNSSQKSIGESSAIGLPPRAQASSRGFLRQSHNSNFPIDKHRPVPTNGYSFSETGSGNILSATFAPLMAGLMTGLGK